MALWFLLALMTAAAIFAVLWPLGRRPIARAEGSEIVVYRDQLAEVDRDRAAGLIDTPEAEAARIEIGRRLLASAASEREILVASNVRARRAVAIVALLGLPAMAAGLYLRLGSPAMPDFPLAARETAPSNSQPLENLVAQVEAHLEKNPSDGRGWTVLAPVLAKLGRFDDASRAYRNSITYNGETASRRADLGETLVAGASGVVTAEAKGEFQRAVALDANEPKANYFLGLAAEQDGRATDAASIWQAMLDKAPADAPWRPLVQSALVKLSSPSVPAPPDDAMAAAKDMSEADRGVMIRGMVDRLAARLKQNGDDVEGWLRLVRAYMVMGDRDKAEQALSDARGAVANDAERLKQFNAGVKTMGLDG